MKIEWILPGLLAGSARPGLLDDLDKDLDQLRRLGIHLIVNLTETAQDPPVESWGFVGVHLPIPDMGTSSPRTVLPVCLQIRDNIAAKKPVLLHCKAGLGRTGMMLACCLTLLGEKAEIAIRRVRLVNPLFIQTPAQERFVAHFGEFVREIERTGPEPSPPTG